MIETVDLTHKLMLIRSQPFFTKLTDKELEELSSLFREKHFSAGDTIVTQGKPVDSVFLIVSGTADVEVARVVDEKLVVDKVATLGANSAIGLNETGFFSLSGMRTATVVATSEIITLCLSVAAFHGFQLANTHVGEVMRKNESKVIEKE